MTNLNILQVWLEQDGAQDATAGGNPASDAFQGPTSAPDIANQGNEPQDDLNNPGQGEEPQSPDISQDPNAPDMPEVEVDEADRDYELWKKEYFDLSIKADANEMIDALSQVRDRDLSAPQRKFVEDNMQIQLLRQDANIERASKEIRKLISQDIDKNNPGTTLLRHINDTLQTYPLLNNIFIKLIGTYGMKSDLYRKYIASLLGATQVGGGGQKEDLIYSESEYSINVSTRFYTDFGNVELGSWQLEEDDPEKYLSDSEMTRLEEGSPEEKRVLRRRIVLESVAARFENRAFIMHVADPSTGMIYSFAWDISNSLRDGYKEGKFVVRKQTKKDAGAMIDDDGKIIPLFDLVIYYLRDTGEVDKRGTPITAEVPFLEERESKLMLVADMEILKELSSGMPGTLFFETPFQGNPSDLKGLMRCTPSTTEILLRRC